MNARRLTVGAGVWGAIALGLCAADVLADGVAVPPSMYKGVPYEGSVEERSQEAILIFHTSTQPGGSREDLILKISVEGQVDRFAWVLPFPNEPEVEKEDAKLFSELYDYVEARLAWQHKARGTKSAGTGGETVPAAAEPEPVEVLSRQVVGSYDVAVVREHQPGALNDWLEAEGYRRLENADDVLDFYREKQYVFACIKVDEAQLNQQQPVDLHPLRFSFKPGGRDGMFFPVKMTGLQQKPFDVNLYVFYGKWVNDKLSKFGYKHRGFELKYRDWDTRQCEPNAGKKYSAPELDPFLADFAGRIPTVAALMQKLHPGEQYYLTNVRARGLKPDDVRQWADDLWLFPYYTDRGFVPFDARPGGPASAAWPESVPAERPASASGTSGGGGFAAIDGVPRWLLLAIGGAAGLVIGGVAAAIVAGYIARRRETEE